VSVMWSLLEALGARLTLDGPNTITIDSSNVNTHRAPYALVRKLAASFDLCGPLLGRFGRAEVPPPGGDVIGRRRVDTHLFALTALGAMVEIDRAYKFWAPGGLHGAELFLDEASVTGTENALMAAALAEGRTTIENAACEPHVQELCELLCAMGSQIEGIGSNLLHIEVRRELGGATHRVRADHIEIGSFIGLAAVTGGDLVIEDADPRDLRSTLHAFERLGVECTPLEDGSLHVPANQELTIRDDVGGQIAKIEDGPWPMFPADLTSIAVAVATQAKGTILVFEKLFENRLVFTDKLVNMGARIILCDPHRVVITGPAKLYGQRLSSPDIRAGMALLIASLAAEGTSVIGDVGQIDRGYERIDERLRALGARIERVTA
jgi:UDP-N-acetylglucosamine 1-carboxyvinyltransferase